VAVIVKRRSKLFADYCVNMIYPERCFNVDRPQYSLFRSAATAPYISCFVIN